MAASAVESYLQAELDYWDYFDDDDDFQEQSQPPASFEYTYHYNIHYQTPDPIFDETDEYSSIYDNILTQAVNLRTLDLAEHDVDLPITLPGEPRHAAEPKLTITNFFRGAAGVDDGEPYKPDATYCKSFKRQVNGKDIQLKDLHMKDNSGPRADEEVKHVAVVGPAGCGKTALMKRYARMVLNSQVPELQLIEVVHYLDVSEMCFEGKPVRPAEMLLNRMIIFKDKKVYDYSDAWMRRNSDRILFVFDNADKVVNKFQERVRRITAMSGVTIEEVIENMITGHFLPGCRTLIAVREWACRHMKGDQRPNRIVVVHPMSDDKKLNLMKSLPDLSGAELAMVIQRRYPMTFHFADNVLFMYFAIYAMTHGNNHDQSKITRDVMLIANVLQYFLRSRYASQELEGKLTSFKKLCFDITSAGTVRFCCRKLESCKGLKDEDMADLVTIAPCHRHGVYFRLFPSDYSYFFSSDIVQEYLTACYIVEMNLKDFKEFLLHKMHTRQWVVIRRFVGAILLNEKTKENTSYFLEKTRNFCESAKLLKSSLKEQAEKLDTLTPFLRYELLATLYECGDSVMDVIECHISSILLPGVPLSPSDLHIISWVDSVSSQTQTINVSLGKDINLAEFEVLVCSALAKSCDVQLDIARMNITLDHVEILKNALRGQPKRGYQTRIQVNESLSEEIVKRMPITCSASSLSQSLDVEAIQVPVDEVAPTSLHDDHVRIRSTSGSATRPKRIKRKGKQCSVM